MEMVYNTKELKELIKVYYKELEGREVEVSTSAKKELVGLYEDEACVVTIKVRETIDMFGMRKKVETQIDTHTLKEMLNALFSTQGFMITNLSLNSGLKEECIGYGMGERYNYQPYFKGVTINVEKNKNLERVRK